MEEEEQEQGASAVGRAAAAGAVLLAIAFVAWLFFGGVIDPYEVTARFVNAGQLVKGNPVESGGVAIGSVSKIVITPDANADITLKIKRPSAPLRGGTIATIRQSSLSGLANRYVDLSPPTGQQLGAARRWLHRPRQDPHGRGSGSGVQHFGSEDA